MAETTKRNWEIKETKINRDCENTVRYIGGPMTYEEAQHFLAVKVDEGPKKADYVLRDNSVKIIYPEGNSVLYTACECA